MSGVRQSTLLRIRPLYVAAFFQGLVFWYTIDKVLAANLGLSTSDIGIILAAMSVLSLIIEIPSGILADRWSRKNVLLISMGSMFIASLIGVFASQAWHYFAISLFWGIFFAMYSGTYEALIYDTLLEEKEDESHYEKYFGRIGRFDSMALTIGSVAGGILAGAISIKAPYAITLAMVLAAMIAVTRFKEPSVHKNKHELSIYKHIGATFRVVVSSRLLVYYFFASMFLGASIRTLFEFNQFWFIEYDLPIALYGVVTALLTLALGLRSVIIDSLRMERHKLLTIILCMSTLLSLTLMIPNRWSTAASLVLTMLAILSAQLVLGALQQRQLPSNVRAGATSVLSTLSHLVFVPVSIGFGYLSTRTVRYAVIIPIILIAVAALFSFASGKHEKKTN